MRLSSFLSPVFTFSINDGEPEESEINNAVTLSVTTQNKKNREKLFFSPYNIWLFCYAELLLLFLSL